MSWEVNLWGSRPGDNDDCWTGKDFPTEAEARVAYLDPERTFSAVDMRSTVFVELVGPGVSEERRIRKDLPEDDGSYWRWEIAVQAGMGLGVEAYNDAMGW